MLASFARALALKRSDALLALHIVALIVVLYGATTFVAEAPRFNVTYRHAGIADYIMRTGAVDRSIDAYYNWPGFFMLAALATKVAGTQSVLAFADWSPLLLNLLYLPPLVIALRAAHPSRELLWVAVCFFYVTNWVGQDYLSPQGFTYLLYLSLIAIALTVLRPASGPAARGPLRRLAPATDLGVSAALSPRARAGSMLVAGALVAATAPSHQLTPVAMVLALAVLAAGARFRTWPLAALAAVLTVGWVVLATGPFLEGHLRGIVDQIGGVQAALSSGVSERVHGSSAHVFVLKVRVVFSIALWGLAGVGIWRSLRRRESTLPHALLTLAPFGLIALQSYGGEVLLRVFLFGLPFTAFFAARAILPASGRLGTRWPAVGVALVSFALVAAFSVARWGNEEVSLYTWNELRAMGELYAIVPPHSRLVAATSQLPWRYRNEYAGYDYQYQYLDESLRGGPPHPSAKQLANRVARLVTPNTSQPTYLVITRGQFANDAVFGAARWGTMATLVRGVSGSSEFRLIYSNPDARIYALRRPASPAGVGSR